ncbi:electron transport complex protein RnfA [Athalassotoga saccharophila]|uniref:electron transport complex protein RnfA n=1 Tax=Athalassotoga saccharophila TaxID=1441386 RepID=UPI00137A16A3|nr:RnfABCDGE type electron transport complex subunit A [Athalassotoga saccharophila]BBJ27571.1 electron transport complex protein RnfA [Athalassotoga saccharophila]
MSANFGELFALMFSAMLVYNFLLSRFLGMCSFFGVSQKIDTAVGMSIAVIFVMVVSGLAAWILNLLLVAWHIEFLQILVFVLVIAALVQFIEIFVKKTNPVLYNALGIYLPLITTNCAVLGVVLLNLNQNYDFLQTLFNTVGSALGYALAIILFASIRERLSIDELPPVFEGMPAAFITAFVLSMGFMAFNGMIKV